jgi:phosphoenolpyruvate carboxykinase (ATP)
LIGDDEHVWTDKGIFNIERGCYAKCVNLSREKEPEIYDAIRFGAIVENMKFLPDQPRSLNFDDISITENTRTAYPLEHIPGAKLPAIGGHPKNIIFLTCDANGVLPPISKLTKEQIMYHFISGYTAKVAGTEMGIVDPVATFSACFGEAFLPLHPYKYAKMLAEFVEKHHANVWLMNTGWSGGKYGVGKRMCLKVSRTLLDRVHDGFLRRLSTTPCQVSILKYPSKFQALITKSLCQLTPGLIRMLIMIKLRNLLSNSLRTSRSTMMEHLRKSSRKVVPLLISEKS